MSTLMQNQPMVTKEELRQEFSKRLNKACDNAGVRSRGRAVDIQKILKSKKVSVTTTAIGKWLNGDASPEQDKLLPLAAWLQVSPAWLEYGEDSNAAMPALPQSHGQLAGQLFNRATPRTQVALKRIQELAAQDKLSDADIDMLMQIVERLSESN